MNTNKLILGALLGGVAFFFLGWLVYGMLLSGYMENNANNSIMRGEEDFVWWSMIASNIAGALVLALVFSWGNVTTVARGMTVGGLLGFLMALGVNLSFYAMSTMFNSVSAVLVDALGYTLMSAVAGAVVAWAMGLAKN